MTTFITQDDHLFIKAVTLGDHLFRPRQAVIMPGPALIPETVFSDRYPPAASRNFQVPDDRESRQRRLP
jgi:hypothetical protein